jgi:D-alanine-D-alanine ligase-like ATP-grasp enzyme
VPDEEFQNKLMRFHRATGLRYGAYDFMIEAETHDHVFLEVNPAGQWAWIEENSGQKISACIAHELCRLAQK